MSRCAWNNSPSHIVSLCPMRIVVTASILAVAVVLAALLISMGTNEGCLPWQTPTKAFYGDRIECR